MFGIKDGVFLFIQPVDFSKKQKKTILNALSMCSVFRCQSELLVGHSILKIKENYKIRFIYYNEDNLLVSVQRIKAQLQELRSRMYRLKPTETMVRDKQTSNKYFFCIYLQIFIHFVHVYMRIDCNSLLRIINTKLYVFKPVL